MFEQGYGDRFRAVCRPDLCKNRRHMLVYAILTDSELLRDVAVRETSHHRLKDFSLPGCQNGNRRILREKPFYVRRDYGLAAEALCEVQFLRLYDHLRSERVWCFSLSVRLFWNVNLDRNGYFRTGIWRTFYGQLSFESVDAVLYSLETEVSVGGIRTLLRIESASVV